MAQMEKAISDHYATTDLLERIETGLRDAGVDPASPAPDDLKPVDEFHTGGLEATTMMLDGLEITPATKVLDVGCGIGGTARLIAHRYGAHVTGVDLTQAFVEVASALSLRCGLDGKTAFLVGSALDMPVASGAFDLATMFHVGMNIEDKAALFGEVSRTLKPGGRFALFDIMRHGPGDIGYPVPWSSTPDCSFVEDPQRYRDAATAAGFALVSEHDRSDYAVNFFKRVIAHLEDQGPPPVGLHLIMGDTAEEKYGNAVKAALDGVTGPWEMVFEMPQ